MSRQHGLSFHFTAKKLQTARIQNPDEDFGEAAEIGRDQQTFQHVGS